MTLQILKLTTFSYITTYERIVWYLFTIVSPLLKGPDSWDYETPYSSWDYATPYSSWDYATPYSSWDYETPYSSWDYETPYSYVCVHPYPRIPFLSAIE